MQKTAHDGFKLPRYFEKVAKIEETEKNLTLAMPICWAGGRFR